MNKKYFALAAVAVAVWYFFIRKTETGAPVIANPLTPRPNTSGNAINGLTNPYVNNSELQRTAATRVLTQGSGSGNPLDASGLLKAGVGFVSSLFNRPKAPANNTGSREPWNDPRINPQDRVAQNSLLPNYDPSAVYQFGADRSNEGVTIGDYGIPNIDGPTSDGVYQFGAENNPVRQDEYGIPIFN